MSTQEEIADAFGDELSARLGSNFGISGYHARIVEWDDEWQSIGAIYNAECAAIAFAELKEDCDGEWPKEDGDSIDIEVRCVYFDKRYPSVDIEGPVVKFNVCASLRWSYMASEPREKK